MINENSLFVRSVSSIIMLLFFFLMVFSNDLIFILLLQLAVFLANWELLRLIEFKKTFVKKVEKSNFFLSRCKVNKYDWIMIVFINLFILFFFLSYVVLEYFLILLIFLSFWKLSDKNFIKYFAIIYVSSPFIFLTYLRTESQFIHIIVFIVIFAMTVDVSALLAGKIFGGPKIAPEISPNKTYSGCIGGLIIPLLLCILFFKNTQNLSNIILLSMILSLVAQCGDLIESKFKRYCLVKDSSNLIPGHGGILDRLDSLILLIIFVSILKLFDYNFFFIV